MTPYLRSQTTIARGIGIIGSNIYTGRDAEAYLHPAPPNTGIQFFTARGSVPATLDYATVRGCALFLEHENALVAFAEHFLAATSLMGIDNLIVHLEEGTARPPRKMPPFFDSIRAGIVPSLPGVLTGYLAEFAKAGMHTYSEEQPLLTVHYEKTIDRPYSPDKFTVRPGAGVTFEASLEYTHHQIPLERAFHQLGDDTAPIADARSPALWLPLSLRRIFFGILGGFHGIKEDEYLLHSGDSLDPWLNGKYSNEAARHRIVDLLGVLTLLGAPLTDAAVSVYKTGMRFEIDALTKLRNEKVIAPARKQHVADVVH